jgi:hypothetical protein
MISLKNPIGIDELAKSLLEAFKVDQPVDSEGGNPMHRLPAILGVVKPIRVPGVRGNCPDECKVELRRIEVAF